GKREAARAGALTKFRTEIQTAVRTAADRRTPYQWIITLMAEKQMDRAARDAANRLPADRKKRYLELAKKLPPAPALPTAMAVADIGPEAPPTYRLVGGNWQRPAKEVQPAFPEALGKDRPDTSLPEGMKSTGRRAALARWLTRKDNPLVARVMVNRL